MSLGEQYFPFYEHGILSPPLSQLTSSRSETKSLKLENRPGLVLIMKILNHAVRKARQGKEKEEEWKGKETGEERAPGAGMRRRHCGDAPRLMMMMMLGFGRDKAARAAKRAARRQQKACMDVWGMCGWHENRWRMCGVVAKGRARERMMGALTSNRCFNKSPPLLPPPDPLKHAKPTPFHLRKHTEQVP